MQDEGQGPEIDKIAEIKVGSIMTFLFWTISGLGCFTFIIAAMPFVMCLITLKR